MNITLYMEFNNVCGLKVLHFKITFLSLSLNTCIGLECAKTFHV